MCRKQTSWKCWFRSKSEAIFGGNRMNAQISWNDVKNVFDIQTMSDLPILFYLNDKEIDKMQKNNAH